MITIMLIFSALRAQAEPLPFQLEKSIEPTAVSWQSFKKTNRDAAWSFMLSRQSVVRQQFEPTFDPYTGVSSMPDLCQLKNMPRDLLIKSGTSPHLLMSVYSSAERVIGDCGDKTRLLKTQYLMIFCERLKQLFVVKYFYSPNKKWLKKPIATCTAKGSSPSQI